MKIVIDIDDNLYTRLFDNGEEYVTDMRRACVAIRKGTPLPKGHGDLIDKKALDKACESSEYHEVITSWLDLAPTIIEADTESEVEE